MDANYVNPALNAIVHIFEQTSQLKPERDKVFIKANNIALSDVSSIIKMEGEAGKGSVAISFPQNVIRVIAQRMLPPGMELSDEIVKDLTGELSNMLAGGMKAELEEAGLQYNISLPEVLSGNPHTILHLENSPVILISFKTEVGPFYVELTFQSQDHEP